jgi:ABC-2 type transport system ATP-binding protein
VTTTAGSTSVGGREARGPAIEAEQLVKHFGETVAVDGVSFTVPRGTVLGLLGPNGAGKTTTVRMMTTLTTPTSGTARVAGHDVVREPEAVRRSMGLTGQAATVDELLTGKENLWLVGSLYGLDKQTIQRQSDDLLERFSLTDAADRTIKTYSGGMRRRLDVAASLVQTPPVLFLDEPTTGLDLPSRNELWRLVRELVSEGTTVLLTTQYLEEADVLADRIAVIDHGHVIANDTPANLKAGLGSTVIELTFDDLDVDRAIALIDGDAEREGATVRITTDRSTKVLLETLRALDTAGIEPSGLTVREPSMDDVFLVLTGHRAEDGSPPTDLSSGGAA